MDTPFSPIPHGVFSLISHNVFSLIPWAIFATAALGVVVYLVYERRRSEAFRVLARQYGFAYRRRSGSLPRQFDFMNVLRQGEDRQAVNILEGIYEGRMVLSFEYNYTTGSGEDKEQHFMSVFMLQLERSFPELRIYPETLWSKLGQKLGFEDIDFESIEFSRAFTVRAADRKFAYDFCHPRMMEYLLRHRETMLEIDREWMCAWRRERSRPQTVIPFLDQLVEMRALMPNYLFAGQTG
ncbi:MAG TPA: hypothetical protein PKO36_16850 [Candidatus Hydrogenedentes bacterium]|nr:hypothetical protein [Candidatus Hydrogenedentota bacterium]HOV75490.1 hypothetical protein [Candidatus Hydrogenedentota bacterium]HPC17169.1 hypothetical protein [Candidatus Hydrogenedentota bacterium]HRT20471.1 hypothetical protein [Candidatus Hydrogenedentota bacterium]HRT65194.1 hypothetical protein [Candidatus Hydrogenedentota bacterium]